MIDLFTLANKVSYQTLYAIRDFCLNKMHNPNKALILAWDETDLDNFIEIFFSDYSISEFKGKNDKESILLDVNTETKIINCNCFNDNLSEIILNINNKSIGLFILVDITQSGFLQNKINKLKLKQSNLKNITWVVQSIEPLLNSDSLIEGLIDFRRILKAENLPINSIMVSNKDHLYSTLFYELYFNTNILNDNRDTYSSEQEFISRFCDVYQKMDTNMINLIGKYIRKYYSLIKENK